MLQKLSAKRNNGLISRAQVLGRVPHCNSFELRVPDNRTDCVELVLVLLLLAGSFHGNHQTNHFYKRAARRIALSIERAPHA